MVPRTAARSPQVALNPADLADYLLSFGPIPAATR